MKQIRKIIKIDEEKCNGCGLCVPSCAEGAIRVIDGKARLVAEKYCDGLGACLGECPEGALQVIDAEVEAFDEAAALEHVRAAGHGNSGQGQSGHAGAPGPTSAAEKTLPCGCPSSLIQTFAPQTPCEKANIPVSRPATGVSALTHWPIQLNLVPPTAPFLRGADLLIASDCVPAAYHRFHDDLLRGKTVLMGCPKFDDAEAYVRKLAAIFTEAGLKSITVAVMEVPCCQGMPAIVRKALNLAEKAMPLQVVTISTRGERLG
ncbi:MAG: 4Fe-4S binding protein [Deltaproteobacteria bacterium]|nr:4Fe-4S binding protein [Deltaproteobacteria bacterium]